MKPQAAPKVNRRSDPTRTKTLRKRYAQRLRGQLGKLNAAIRTSIVDQDIFGLKQNATPKDPTPADVFQFTRDSTQADQFMDWLERQEKEGLLRIIERNDNPFIRSSYERGLDHAERELRTAGMQTGDVPVQEIFNRPVHQDAVQLLYTRNLQELQGITEAMNQQITRELADGFQKGLNPRDVARNITDRVNKVGKHRATVMARTEIINAHSEATLNRYERMGVENVTVRAELSTAGDNRVCPICASLEGKTYSLQEARSSSFDFDPSEVDMDTTPSMSGSYRMRPPLHPQCRCALVPVVS